MGRQQATENAVNDRWLGSDERKKCVCAEDNACCHFWATRKVNGNTIKTLIKMKPGCTECKGSCCDFTSTRIDPGANLHFPTGLAQNVRIQMNRGCTDCKGCCDDRLVRGENRTQTTMIHYCDPDDFRC